MEPDPSAAAPRRRPTPVVAAVIVACWGFAAAAQTAPSPAGRIEALTPALEAYVAEGMAAFDAPGVAIGIVAGDELVYAKGFGSRSKGGDPVDTATVFQIGSTTKAFLATSMAIAVDRGKLAWDDRVVDRYPEFQMMDPWVTGEFRVFDLLAQRSGLPPYANDAVGMLGADQDAMIRSLRHVAPVSSFRSTFAYTNITHMLAQRVVAQAMGAADWETLIRDEIFDPLGMTGSSFTAEAIEAAPNHAEGHRWTPDGAVVTPFTPLFPYGFGAAGAINSNIDDLQHWMRLLLGDGTFEGKPIVTAENLAVTRIPRVGIAPTAAYAMGWVVQSTPNGRVVWHNGGTSAFGAYIGTLPDFDVGVIVLSNLTNVGLPDAIGEWTMDRLLGNPEVDYAAAKLEAARAADAAERAVFAAPADAGPPPPLGPLAGAFDNPSFGPATVAVDGDGLAMTLDATGARLRLSPWNGGVFTVALTPEGRFATIAANLGDAPLGFAEFAVDATGKPNRLTLTLTEGGMAYEFVRR